ncbi:hypothetical protein [Duncaniella freteri]|uniref:hypothetical protein n=1 Tax=Duncaniella freteri TaxID=2530391 RepID=UPI0025723E3A|nr:hypothetical protein [Duncaniella freteri]
MTLQELSEKILSSPRGEALRKALGSRTRIISVYNLASSRYDARSHACPQSSHCCRG